MRGGDLHFPAAQGCCPSRYSYFLVLSLILSVFIIQAVQLPIYLDEFTYAHAAWLIAKGEIPYRDFALFHPPLVELLLAPVFWLTNDAGTAVLIMRVVCGLLAASSLLMAERLSNALPYITILFAISTGILLEYLVQIRPDSLALFFFMLSCCLMQKRSISAGAIASALAVASSEKAAIYGLSILFLVERRDWARFVAVSILSLALLYGSFALWAGIGPLWEFLITWSIRHAADYPRIPFYSQIYPQLPLVGTLLVLSLRGVRGASDHGRHFFWAFLVLGGCSYFLQPGQFAYSAMPFLLPLAIAAARGFSVFDVVQRTWRALSIPILLPLLTALILHVGTRHQETIEQRELFQRLEQIVPPESCVFDSTGLGITRPHAHFYFFIDAKLRDSLGGTIEREVAALLESGGCGAVIKDGRFSLLGSKLRDVVARNFPRCFGALCVRESSPLVGAD